MRSIAGAIVIAVGAVFLNRVDAATGPVGVYYLLFGILLTVVGIVTIIADCRNSTPRS
jgi:uncharacterized membrane protein HdeD (DUF308 family)